MQALDVINASIIRKDEYSYLIESKTFLYVSKPTSGTANRAIQAFFFGLPLAFAAGLAVEGGSAAWIFSLGFIALFSGFHLARSFLPGRVTGKWTLYVGSGEQPIELFQSDDEEIFCAKRLEIEQALMTKPN